MRTRAQLLDFLEKSLLSARADDKFHRYGEGYGKLREDVLVVIEELTWETCADLPVRRAQHCVVKVTGSASRGVPYYTCPRCGKTREVYEHEDLTRTTS